MYPTPIFQRICQGNNTSQQGQTRTWFPCLNLRHLFKLYVAYFGYPTFSLYLHFHGFPTNLGPKILELPSWCHPIHYHQSTCITISSWKRALTATLLPQTYTLNLNFEHVINKNVCCATTFMDQTLMYSACNNYNHPYISLGVLGCRAKRYTCMEWQKVWNLYIKNVHKKAGAPSSLSIDAVLATYSW